MTAAEIDELRVDIVASMPSLGTVSRNTPTVNATGGRQSGWAAAGTYVCNVFPDSQGKGDERDVQGRIAAVRKWRIVFPHDADVTEEDRVTTEGVQYEVVHIDGSRSWQLELETICERRA